MIIRAAFSFVLAAAVAVSPAFATRAHHSSASGHARTRRHLIAAKSHTMHGQQAIDSARVTAIQQALIREHYLTGEPTAKWDAETQAAMLKYQGDQGWQTRLTPDSRALIKLGLGPDHSGAINASSSSSFNTLTSPTDPSQSTTQGFVAASGVSR